MIPNIEKLVSLLSNVFAMCRLVGEHDGTFDPVVEHHGMRAGGRLVALLLEQGEKGEEFAGKLCHTLQCALAGTTVEATSDGSEEGAKLAALVQKLHDVAKDLRKRLLALGLNVSMPEPKKDKPDAT